MFSYYSKFIDKFSDKKIHVLNRNREFPVPPTVLEAFLILKKDLKENSSSKPMQVTSALQQL